MPAIASYITVILIWATTRLAIKFSNDSVSPLVALGFRLTIALLVALLCLVILRRASFVDARNVKNYWLASLSLFPNMPLVYYAAEYIPSGLIAVMFGLSPFFTALMARIMLGESSFSLRQLVGQGIALAGLLVIFFSQLSVDSSAAVGVLLILASCSVYSYSLVAVKRRGLIHKANALDQTAGATLFALPGIAISWYLIDGSHPRALSETSMLAIMYLALVGSLIGFVAFYRVVDQLNVATISMIPMITPVVALWLGAAFADEPITAETLIGTGLIICGLVVYENLIAAGRKLRF